MDNDVVYTKYNMEGNINFDYEVSKIEGSEWGLEKMSEIFHHFFGILLKEIIMNNGEITVLYNRETCVYEIFENPYAWRTKFKKQIKKGLINNLFTLTLKSIKKGEITTIKGGGDVNYI